MLKKKKKSIDYLHSQKLKGTYLFFFYFLFIFHLLLFSGFSLSKKKQEFLLPDVALSFY